jgi:hypothetical protein
MKPREDRGDEKRPAFLTFMMIVCLSLLGTWTGEPWRPGQSTILQVLTSIQAMVLCDQPWYNEPGYQLSPDPLRSESYNQEIRHYTAHHAMLRWLKAEKSNIQGATGIRSTDKQQAAANIAAHTKIPFWSMLVTKHFRTRRENILATVNAWASASLGTVAVENEMLPAGTKKLSWVGVREQFEALLPC